MKHQTRLLLSMLAVCWLFSLAAPTSTSAEEFLSGEQIRALISGTTVTTESRRGHPMTIEFAPDSTLSTSIETPRRTLRDNGRWWISNKGTMCFLWLKFGQGKKRCVLLKPDDNLLVYYAGHGVLDDIAEQGYWLPVDAEEGNPTNWISTSDVTTMLRVIRAKHIMVVADSCYSGTLVRAVSGRIKTARAQTEWVKRMAAKRARTALVSGGLEPVSDGSGKHSVFAKAFLDALSANTSVMPGAALYDAIKRPVVLNADQTPQYSDIRRAGHDGGDFLFVRKTP